MNNVLESALHDVLPTVHILPANLKSETANLYNRSRSSIPLRATEESARYHICAIIAANKYKAELGVLGPSIDRVPLPPKATRAFINMFNKQLNGIGNSTTSSPTKNNNSNIHSSPNKRQNGSSVTNINEMRDLLKTPRKRGRPPKNPGLSQSPTKTKSPFIQRLEHASGSLMNMNDLRSSSLSPSKSPSRSPLRHGEIYRDQEPQTTSKRIKVNDSNNPFLDPASSPQNDYTNTHNISIYDSSIIGSGKSRFRVLNSLEIITLCNKFQIPAHVTSNILSTFQKYHSAASNEWMILCGLILNVYFVIHNKGINTQIGSKSRIIKTMFDLQNGGLLISEMKKGISLVWGLVEFAGWFKKLRAEYGDVGGDSESDVVNDGSFITESWRFVSGVKKKAEFEEWLANINMEISENLGENNRGLVDSN